MLHSDVAWHAASYFGPKKLWGSGPLLIFLSTSLALSGSATAFSIGSCSAFSELETFGAGGLCALLFCHQQLLDSLSEKKYALVALVVRYVGFRCRHSGGYKEIRPPQWSYMSTAVSWASCLSGIEFMVGLLLV